MIWRKALVRVNFSFSHSHSLTKRIFRQINSSNFFTKNVTFTKFLPKICESKFPLISTLLWRDMTQTHTLLVWKLREFTHTILSQKSREINAIRTKSHCILLSRNFCFLVKKKFPNFHATAQCENCWNFVWHIFGKNFVKVTFLLKKLLNM